jgi:excisionase family DNA binding protein
MNEKQKMYTASDLAKMANVSASYVARLCRKGQLKATKLGPVWLIDAETAEEWLASRTEHQE